MLGKIVPFQLLGIMIGIMLLLPACRSLPGPVSGPEGSQGAAAGHLIQSVPDNLDTSLSHSSKEGLFEVSVRSQLDPIVINEIHSWVLTLSTPSGDAVENAEITIAHLMPQHGHGMPTEPQVTRYLGDGEYLVEGMKFNMRGWWTIDFTIAAPAASDVATFNLILR